MLNTIADRVDSRLAKRSGCLPRQISPQVTRGSASKRPRLWNDDLGGDSDGHPSSPHSVNHRPRLGFPTLNLAEEAKAPPTPCKDLSVPAVSRDLVNCSPVAAATQTSAPSPPTPPKRLEFRLPPDEFASLKISEFSLVVSELTRLSKQTRPLPRDPDFPGLVDYFIPNVRKQFQS